jgi:SPP1 gp7 family putative phage head morphogenesis protein
VWSTQLDERVRPLHENREGQVFSWDDPPSDGHPGFPPGCRCVAAPYVA